MRNNLSEIFSKLVAVSMETKFALLCDEDLMINLTQYMCVCVCVFDS